MLQSDDSSSAVLMVHSLTDGGITCLFGDHAIGPSADESIIEGGIEVDEWPDSGAVGMVSACVRERQIRW